jgi:hypothetical protein
VIGYVADHHLVENVFGLYFVLNLTIKLEIGFRAFASHQGRFAKQLFELPRQPIGIAIVRHDSPPRYKLHETTQMGMLP